MNIHFEIYNEWRDWAEGLHSGHVAIWLWRHWRVCIGPMLWIGAVRLIGVEGAVQRGVVSGRITVGGVSFNARITF